VLWSGNEAHVEPNQSAQSSGVTLLDDFISNNYMLREEFGMYAIRSREIPQ
jgi:hypothetical protein